MWYQLWYQPNIGKTILDPSTLVGNVWIPSDGYRIGLIKGIQVVLIMNGETLSPTKKYQIRPSTNIDLKIFSRDLPYDPTIFIISDVKYPLFTLLPDKYHPNPDSDRYYALVTSNIVVVLSSIDEIYGMRDWLYYMNIGILRIENQDGCDIITSLINVQTY
jgi:hypothetical protein